MSESIVFSLDEIAEKLGYTFKNDTLLQQALWNETCAKADNMTYNHTPLVQYGKLSYDLFLGYVHNKEGDSLDSEGFLTQNLFYQQRDPLNESSFLFPLYLGIPPYVLHCLPSEMDSIDLFTSYCQNLTYAIIGAVVIDSDWNPKAIFNICKTIYSLLIFNDNYIKLLDSICNSKDIPLTYKEIKQIDGADTRSQQWICKAIIGEKEYEMVSPSPITAKMKTACKMYHDLFPIILEESCELPNKEQAISQLELIEDKDLIQGVKFEFNHMKEDGVTKYHCKCTVRNPMLEENTFAQSKALAKKEAAYNILCRLFNSPDKLHFTDDVE